MNPTPERRARNRTRTISLQEGRAFGWFGPSKSLNWPIGVELLTTAARGQRRTHHIKYDVHKVLVQRSML
jgi:hypothetical protein